MSYFSTLLKHESHIDNQILLWEFFNTEFEVIKRICPAMVYGLEYADYTGYTITTRYTYINYQYMKDDTPPCNMFLMFYTNFFKFPFDIRVEHYNQYKDYHTSGRFLLYDIEEEIIV